MRESAFPLFFSLRVLDGHTLILRHIRYAATETRKKTTIRKITYVIDFNSTLVRRVNVSNEQNNKRNGKLDLWKLSREEFIISKQCSSRELDYGRFNVEQLTCD